MVDKKKMCLLVELLIEDVHFSCAKSSNAKSSNARDVHFSCAKSSNAKSANARCVFDVSRCACSLHLSWCACLLSC